MVAADDRIARDDSGRFWCAHEIGWVARFVGVTRAALYENGDRRFAFDCRIIGRETDDREGSACA